VLLNITPDHLDRYESFEAYAASKARLFEMQSRQHTAIISGREPATMAVGRKVDNVRRPFAILSPDEEAANDPAYPTLQGPHNAQNRATARLACECLYAFHESSNERLITDQQIEDGLRTYPGLPHRMERIREKDGVLFVNDSKATNPTATAPALAAFEKIRWICGGQAKTDNLDECAPHFAHVRKAYTIGEASELFAGLLSPHMDVAQCETLERAVREAAGDAEAGDTVLLSPACASFDQFRDFEQRGDKFRELVGAL
jgi:UDP-N-acetylmuramoylalanine--D-glutamate ligase